MSLKDITGQIEQIEAFEERLGVSFKSLSAFLDVDDEDYMSIKVRGEMHAKTGNKLKEDIQVIIAVYDKADRVVGTDYRNFDSDDFYGFDTFSESVDISVKDISKVRIYPKKS